MKPRITFLTLGVDDLDRAVRFYRDGLGLSTAGIVGREYEHGAAAFFKLAGGLTLALYGRDDLAWDAGMARAEAGAGASGYSIGHNVRTREEVDAVLAQAARAGARIIKPGSETFWGGYAGYFQDPDGHLWEVAWNPKVLPED